MADQPTGDESRPAPTPAWAPGPGRALLGPGPGPHVRQARGGHLPRPLSPGWEEHDNESCGVSQDERSPPTRQGCCYCLIQALYIALFGPSGGSGIDGWVRWGAIGETNAGKLPQKKPLVVLLVAPISMPPLIMPVVAMIPWVPQALHVRERCVRERAGRRRVERAGGGRTAWLSESADGRECEQPRAFASSIGREYEQSRGSAGGSTGGRQLADRAPPPRAPHPGPMSAPTPTHK